MDIGDHSGVVPGRLFTWVDVDEHLSYLAEAGQWPEWLLEADAWWDQLALTVRSHATEDMVRAWLDRAFGRGSVIGEPGRPMLALDRPRGLGAEGIPVTLDAIDDRSPERRVPRLTERRTTAELAQTLPRPRSDRFAGDVQVIAFHSFKGGVGRTVHAVALADQLARQGRRVLLIDADLEAPGITWMHQAQGGTSDISYEDVLALLHGTDDGGTASVTEIVRDYLAGQFVVGTGPGRLAILPATRRSRLGPPRVEPVDLLTHDRSAYFLTESLAEVASAAELDTVIIDLRAGASELSAPVLLDPRVQRVFITTLSHQSLDGTLRMIGQLGAKAPALLGQDPAPAAVVTQYRMDVHDDEAEGARRKLSDALLGTLSVSEGDEQEGDLDVDTQALTAALVSPFRDELLALPGSWDEVVEVVRRCGLGERVAELAPQPSSGGGLRAEESGPVGIEELRTMLRDRAASLVFAERTGLDGALGFLSTEPLRRLIGDHRGSLPVAVVVGAKGAGKTFTYARMCAAGSWSGFAEKAGLKVLDDALVVPVLDPANLDQETTGERSTSPQDLRDLAAGGEGTTRTQILRLLNESLRSPENGTDPDFWLYIWLRCMALAGGSEAARDIDYDAEHELLELGRQRQLLFVFDGLEDFLQELEGEAKRVALRALLVDVPEWLRSLRGRPLGLVVFVRRDLAAWAIRQNLGQFLDRYDPYALRWDAQEALRLALWVAVTAKAVPEPPERELMELSYEEITRALHSVWGAKLGSDSSREAWSDRWVPAALADFNDQVQARDVVRFLREAANLSAGDERTDRLLVPTAMRTALVQCSSEKVKEIGQENKKLGDLLRGLERYAHEVLMPFSADDVGLDANGIEVLRDAGALAADSDGRYRLPEIYRHALGFRTQGRARVVRR
ncbi:ParA family protein [Streptomyces sp. NBC_00576]|uniref:ParA family protein n=1 Tax=Streptomyces sp. NBC_00576 TaxID=2903665 RepID=UPI002E81B407|nr:ParA family protein [Streptomyces sp. NBC_00576]WUB72417.1 AAA family ATPase [Streptomyces sp. NBC_00576]